MKHDRIHLRTRMLLRVPDDGLNPELIELIGPTVWVSRVRDRRVIEVPQALADDPPAFAAMLDWLAATQC